jgi:hypothetical protein
LWTLLAEPASEPELVEAMADAYGVPAEQVAPDLGHVLNDLHERGLAACSLA